MRIALTGNPNSGKTTMFNALTGRNEKVGNWAGVTVDKKEHSIKKSFSTQENVIARLLPVKNQLQVLMLNKKILMQLLTL